MSSTVTRPVPTSPSIDTARVPARHDQIARGVLAVAAVGALVSALGALGTATAADDAMAVVAWHDLLGFPVFAALFALLAWRPRGYPGIWELLVAQKAVIAIVVASLARGGADDAALVATVDAVLAMALAVAYLLARAHTAWTRPLNGVDR
ncbi:MAG TPA: hypothetical protein VGT61_13255 [Thermomicrobiales bacterium]|jgi:hypothetical protein|nr:hypothetical protein [Thermomicrobiales bacterium]